MKKQLLLILLVLSISVQAQYTILPKTINCDKVNLKIKDDTLYIQEGTRGSLILKNLENVTVIGKNVNIKANAGYGIWISNCKNLKLSGIDQSLIIDGGNQGIKVSDLSTDIEIEQVEIKNTGFAGIMAKTDPNCDPKTWRANFHMKNLFIHHNYIHNTGGEGLYIGYTFYAGSNFKDCGLVLAHTLSNVHIYNNRVEDTDADGIQCGSATGGAYIYNNIISNTGLRPFQNFQSNGIQIGDGTSGAVYNNIINNASAVGIILLGTGNNTIHNNSIANATIGVFTDERSGTKLGSNFTVTNNTIINCKNYGVSVYSEQMNNYIINNVIFCNKPINKLNPAVKTIENNNVYKLDSLTFQGYKQ